MSQSVPTPAPEQDGEIMLYGGIAHIGDGTVIENSVIGFKKGKIILVADASLIKLNPDSAEIIDITGKHVYPGLIAANTVLGLREIGAVRATSDHDETGGLNPNVRSLIAYNTDSRVVPTIRSNGILMAQVTPQGGVISGQSSVVQLDAWNWEDAQVQADDGIWLSWPWLRNHPNWWEESAESSDNDRYTEEVTSIRDFFYEAKAYWDNDETETTNLKFEALRGLFDKTKKLFIRASTAKAMMAAIDFARELDVDLVIVGGRDSWMMTETLVENNVEVMLGNVQELPGYRHDDIDQPFKTPKILQDAGVSFCLTRPGFWDVRNLPFAAGTAAAYGLTKEEALASITINVAKILGIDDQCGTIADGKDATIIVSTGDILDMTTSSVEQAFYSRPGDRPWQ